MRPRAPSARRARLLRIAITAVFSLGMTAAATLSIAVSLSIPELDVLGQVLRWVAAAAWLAVGAGAVAEARAGLRAAR
ncbi:hypothetical protein [Streptomyces sennicomposti]